MEFVASAPDIDDTDQVAIDHEECSVCFDPLFSRQVSFFLNRNKKRICRHYFHTVIPSSSLLIPSSSSLLLPSFLLLLSSTSGLCEIYN